MEKSFLDSLYEIYGKSQVRATISVEKAMNMAEIEEGLNN